jgi:GTPase SAR1 family protein
MDSFKDASEIRVGLLGLSGVGKTNFLNTIKGQYKRNYMYIATCDSYLSPFNTYEIKYKEKKIIFHDFSGTERYMEYPFESPEFHNFDIVALMIDNTKISYTEGKKWHRKILNKFPGSKALRIRNKIDIVDKNPNTEVSAVEISVKNKTGLENVLDEIIKIHS